MDQLHSVVLGDAGWIVSLLAGLLIESRFSKAARRRQVERDNVSGAGGGWLTATTRSSLTKNIQLPFAADDLNTTEKPGVISSNTI